jgi:hypothetical protein
MLSNLNIMSVEELIDKL